MDGDEGADAMDGYAAAPDGGGYEGGAGGPPVSSAAPPATRLPSRQGSSASAGGGGDAHQPSEATLRWKAEQEKRAKVKDAENEKKKRELHQVATAKLEHLRAERQKRVATQLAANKDAAKKLADPGAKGAGWAKVAALVDLDKETPDRERMRAVLKTKAKEG